MDQDFNLENIKPLISTDVLKTITDEFDKILCNISERFGISIGDLRDFTRDDMNKVGIKLGIKKRNRRVLPADKQCMGRKLDGKQCTRGRYKPGCDYCKSHANKLPLGRIDDEMIPKEPAVRGRKRKNEKKMSEFIMTRIETIQDINYLVDEKNFVYSFNQEAPQFLGIKMDGSIKSLTDLGIKVC